ncbi:hypothetical protein TH61_16310 [Rufibacter sp. DG15C]|uniref:hypothetical protein n=1 Tax=Rufibacter sp. DG15C TaxID=1379909 RepID=UPI00078E2A31|nr:hypothetical protein [Rufibacter sp. DG15C]AMM52440.1 hypothetical protein TH61_16310 [Rufibacter sp. DG15C]
MEQILYNETLYDSGEVRVYKTYDPELKLFGLYSANGNCGKCLDAAYRHIFPFIDDDTAPAITEKGEYVWLDLAYNETAMNETDGELWASVHINNSLCNCGIDIEKLMDCGMCSAGKILNEMNFRRLREFTATRVYEYETEENLYRIELTPKEGECQSADYLWEDAELEPGLRGEIDTYEEQVAEMKNNLKVCVYERFSMGISIFFYTVRISKMGSPLLFSDIIAPKVIGFYEFTSKYRRPYANRH